MKKDDSQNRLFLFKNFYLLLRKYDIMWIMKILHPIEE